MARTEVEDIEGELRTSMESAEKKMAEVKELLGIFEREPRLNALLVTLQNRIFRNYL